MPTTPIRWSARITLPPHQSSLSIIITIWARENNLRLNPYKAKELGD